VEHCKPDISSSMAGCYMPDWLVTVSVQYILHTCAVCPPLRCSLCAVRRVRVRGLGPACSSTGHSQVSAGYMGTAGYSAALATWLEAWVGGPLAGP
jgi:hypothetical protein